MKFLFDQNISFRVIKKISHLYPGSQQIRVLGLDNASDIDVWKYAEANGYSIVSFDTDFYDIANLKGHPPKIVWLRIGNTTTDNLVNVLIDKYDLIKDFILNPDNKGLACLEIK